MPSYLKALTPCTPARMITNLACPRAVPFWTVLFAQSCPVMIQQMGARRYTMVADHERKLHHEMDHLHKHLDHAKKVCHRPVGSASRLYWWWDFFAVQEYGLKKQSTIKMSLVHRAARFESSRWFKCEYIVLLLTTFHLTAVVHVLYTVRSPGCRLTPILVKNRSKWMTTNR